MTIRVQNTTQGFSQGYRKLLIWNKTKIGPDNTTRVEWGFLTLVQQFPLSLEDMFKNP